MSNYLVLGSAGFIASRVCDLLLWQGHTVHGVDSLDDFYNPLLKLWRIEQLKAHSRFKFHESNIEDLRALGAVAGLFDPIDAVIHLAARAGVRPSVENPWAYINTNIIGTLNVLELCRQLNIPKLVIASSSSVYGAHNPMPYHEDADTNRPISPYAASKKATEELSFTYHHLYGHDISLLRFFTVYGPAGRPDMSMFRFIRNIVEGQPITVYGDGLQSRDFSFVEDIARGVCAALKPVGYRIFNLGANHPVQLRCIIESIERLSHRTAIIDRQKSDPTDVPATWADVSRAKEELEWEPSVSLEEGICHSLKWYQVNRHWVHQI